MDTTVQLIVNIGAAATALAALIGLPVAMVKLWPLLKRAVTIGGSLEKLPEMALELSALAIGQRAQGATLDQQSTSLAAITTEVETVKQQVKNSHDTNLREDIDLVRDHVLELHGKLDRHLSTPTTTVNVHPVEGS